MPPKSFAVRVDQDDLAKQDLAAALTRQPATRPDQPAAVQAAVDAAHHGARDNKQATRGRTERDHARNSGGKSRSYAFRRS
jgi:hypothetical protein